MQIGRHIKRGARAVAPPAVFLALVGYFAWNTSQGDLGLKSYAQRQADYATAQTDLAAAAKTQAVWERRVAGLRLNRLDIDTLDERARAMLNLADPTEIVVPYGQSQRLF